MLCEITDEIHQPAFFENPGRIIVIGDIHGDIDRLLHIFISLNIFSHTLEWIAQPPNTIVIQLGDQIDSMDRTGTNPYWDNTSSACPGGILDLNILMLMDKLDAIAFEAGHGGRVLSLIGNHELLNLMHEFHYVSPCSLNIINAETRKQLFAYGNGQFTQLLAKRNIVVKIGNFLFCHGGILPEHLELLQNIYGTIDLNKFNNIFRKFVYTIGLEPNEAHILQNAIIGDNGILWTRVYMHLLTRAQQDTNTNTNINIILENILNNILTQTNTLSMFIGHNTVDRITTVSNNKLFFMDASLSRAYNSCNNQVIEIVTDVTTGISNVNLIEIPCN